MNFTMKKATFLLAAGVAVTSFWAGTSHAAGTQALATGGTHAVQAPKVGTQALTNNGTKAARPGQPMNLGTQALTNGGTQAVRNGTQALGGTQALAGGGTQAVRNGTQALRGTQALTNGTQAVRNGTQALGGTQALTNGTQAVRNGTQALRGTQATGTLAAGSGSVATIVPAIQGPIRAVSTKTPGTLVVLQDASGSMLEEFMPGTQKAQAAANAINTTLADFARSSNQGGAIRNRWNIGVFHYGGKGVKNGFGGTLAGARGMVPISDVAQHPADVLQIPDPEGQMVPSPLWVHAAAEGGTPMTEAFHHVAKAIDGHEKHLVLGVHVTDGASTDGDPSKAVAALNHKVTSAGGQLLMTNIHISANADPAKALVFPTAADVSRLNDPHASLLFSLSSPVPASLAEQLGTPPGARMFAYNAAPDQLAQVFRAGSSVAGGTVAP